MSSDKRIQYERVDEDSNYNNNFSLLYIERNKTEDNQ